MKESNISKSQLIHAILGTDPSYDAMQIPIIAKCGSYTGGFKDHWSWHKNKLVKLTIEDLNNIYVKCKSYYYSPESLTRRSSSAIYNIEY